MPDYAVYYCNHGPRVESFVVHHRGHGKTRIGTYPSEQQVGLAIAGEPESRYSDRGRFVVGFRLGHSDKRGPNYEMLEISSEKRLRTALGPLYNPF